MCLVLWIGCGLSVAGCGAGDASEQNASLGYALAKDLGGLNGDTDYCVHGGCAEGEGDCDDHSDCLSGLICGSDNGAEFGMPATWDVCTAACPRFVLEAPSTTFCSELCPCSLGQGDCDSDSECAPDLVCRSDFGAAYGLPDDWDVCTPACLPIELVGPSAAYCSDRCPCGVGEGDCDRDSQCAAGLVCGNDSGPEFGLPRTWDACTTPCPAFDPSRPSKTFCSPACPCGPGEGDCDRHGDCKVGLVCAKDNGPEFGLPMAWDVCTGTCPLFDPSEPSETFCSPLCPCGFGQGDCDSHSECQPGLLCGSDNGPEFGLPSSWDVCTTACPSFDSAAPSATFCSELCPCNRGEGDCDSDAECAPGLRCDLDQGPQVGLPEDYDLCRWTTRLLFWGQDAKISKLPGNSLPAIENAHSLGYDGVEIDLRLTGDDRLILMHDGNLDTTTNGAGVIRSMSLEAVQQYQLLPVQQPPVAIATLEDALSVNGARGIFLADVKNGSIASQAIQVAVDASHFEHERFLLSAYGIDEAAAFKTQLPWATILVKSYQYPSDVTQDAIDAVVSVGAAGMMMELPDEVATIEPLLSKLHSRGLMLVLFVHSAGRTFEELEAMAMMGVDYVLTVPAEYLF